MFILCYEAHREKVVEWARIGRVRRSKTGRTLYYEGRELKGRGCDYLDVETHQSFFIRPARKDGLDISDGAMRRSFPVDIDEDVREEYWTQIRNEPSHAHKPRCVN